MSYAIYDVNGYKGDMASGGGLEALGEYASLSGNKVLKRFIEEGFSEAPDELVVAIGDKIDATEDVAETLKNLKMLAGECEEIAIISNGIEESVEGEEDEK